MLTAYAIAVYITLCCGFGGAIPAVLLLGYCKRIRRKGL